MRVPIRFSLFSLAVLCLCISCAEHQKPKYVLVIHGGAGAMNPDMPDSLRKAYADGMLQALKTGETVLKEGGTSMDAVEKTIRILEDNPLFNAGKGAVYTHEGTISLDASIMDGSTLKAGAVAAVADVKNPISLARTVMTSSEHVFLSGTGASEFARERGLEIVDSSYFFTPNRWNDHLKGLQNEKHGTVGCVALDVHGNLAAGTSTGGMTNKRWGRIGDTPVIGAGTYANNKSAGISCTGHGEYFIRYVVAHEVSNMVEYKGWTVKQAGNFIINEQLRQAGGNGGLIAIDRNGNIAMPYNTTGMFRAYSKSNGEWAVYIFDKPEIKSDKPVN
jgi:L-asparaginase / beta-aspartyl-peptidase